MKEYFVQRINGTLSLVDNESLKTMGIVSERAKWVKVEDRFLAEGKDCEVFPLHNHTENGTIYYVDEEGNKVDTPIYLIKCPTCGCFK